MPRRGFNQRFTTALRKAYGEANKHGGRSTQKIKVLHGWVQDELRLVLGDDYELSGQSLASSKEEQVSGTYYNKKVDVLVSRDDQPLAVVSVKFPISSYGKNAINYIEQQIGETANLRRSNIVYGNLFFLTDPIPYTVKGETRYERFGESEILRYDRLRSDHEHAHSPDEMAIGIVALNAGRNGVIGIRNADQLNVSEECQNILNNQLSVELFFKKMALRIELRYLSP